MAYSNVTNTEKNRLIIYKDVASVKPLGHYI